MYRELTNFSQEKKQVNFTIYEDLLHNGCDITSGSDMHIHITTSGVVVRNDGKVLHIKHLALNKWLLPGGHCEREDNSLVSASLREIEEETGISSHNLVLLQSTPLDVDLHIIPANPKKERQNLWYTCLSTLRPGDLCIRDLGYFSLDDLDQMDQRGVSYVSHLKLNNRIYQKNPEPEYFRDGTIKKQTEYIQLDLEELMQRMQPGETVEIRDAYIGKDKKLLARVILYRLTDVQVQKRRKDLAYKEKKKGVTYSEKSKRLMGINVYITNIAWEIVPKERIHDLYSLRWQVEIVFKTWKSFFQIDRCKDVKRERLECHLYRQLIAILICSTTLFQMREILLRKKHIELSEYKAFRIIQTYFPLFHQAIQQQNTQAYAKILLRLFHLLGKNGL